jgi:hypothetical protein
MESWWKRITVGISENNKMRRGAHGFIQQVLTSFTARAASYSVFAFAFSYVSTHLKFIAMGNRQPLFSSAVSSVFVARAYGDNLVYNELSRPEATAPV